MEAPACRPSQIADLSTASEKAAESGARAWRRSSAAQTILCTGLEEGLIGSFGIGVNPKFDKTGSWEADELLWQAVWNIRY